MNNRVGYCFLSKKTTTWTEKVVQKLSCPDEGTTYLYTQSNKGSAILAARLKKFLANFKNQLQGEEITFYEISPQKQEQNVLKKCSLVKVSDIRTWQQHVQVWYDSKHVTPAQVLDIQRCKAGIPLENENKDPYYRHKLECLSSYVVVRGETRQIYEMADQPQLLDKPRKRIIYYATFPKLQYTNKKGTSFEYFTSGEDKKGKGGKPVRDLDQSKIEKLKEMFKDVLRLQIQVAAHHKEGLDVVTPNAFFYGLTEGSQRQAKRLFYQAVAEVAAEKGHLEFPGLFIHTDYHCQVELEEINTIFQDANLLIPVMLGTGDAAAPQLAAQGLDDYPVTNVADCIMGEGLGCVGNAATIVGAANNAKEEMDTRLMMGLNIAVLDPNYNSLLLNIESYRPIVSAHSVELDEKQAEADVNFTGGREKILENIEIHLASLYQTCETLETITPKDGTCRHETVKLRKKIGEFQRETIPRLQEVGTDSPACIEIIRKYVEDLLKQSLDVSTACDHLQIHTLQMAKMYRLRGALIGAVVGICVSLAVIIGGLVAAPVGGLLAGSIGVTLFGAGIGSHFSASHTFSVAAKIKIQEKAISEGRNYIKAFAP
jgi:hypothetical protein